MPSRPPSLKPAKRSDAARSPKAAVYHRWYSSHRWKLLRKRHLEAHPLCVSCDAAGRTVIATVCDHVEPHRGDPTKFWSGPFQSLCDEAPWRCHSKRKQQSERALEQVKNIR